MEIFDLFVDSDDLEKWRDFEELSRKISSNLYAIDIIDFIHRPLHKEKVLLHKKYVEEGLSLRQISEQIFSSKEAVRTSLIDAGVELRPKSKPHNRPSQLKYGQKMRKGKAVTHFAEERVIRAVIEMRESGMTLRQIAKFLTEIGVPTKNRGKAWHPEMINRVLSRKNGPESDGVRLITDSNNGQKLSLVN